MSALMMADLVSKLLTELLNIRRHNIKETVSSTCCMSLSFEHNTLHNSFYDEIYSCDKEILHANKDNNNTAESDLLLPTY